MNSVLDDPEFKARMNTAYELERARVDQLRTDLAVAEERLDALGKLRGNMTSEPARSATLSGDSLRAEAHRMLKQIDPAQNGILPRRLTELLLQEGFRIGGKAEDKTPNVRSSIGYGPKAAKLFRAVGNGLYTWK
jgi:hypothetical protein